MKKKYTKLTLILINILLVQSNFAQVGAGTTSPTTGLDINGALSLREASLNLINGSNNNVSLGATPYSLYKISGPTGDFSISGILPVTGSDGQVITLENDTDTTMTLVHDATSTSANRIVCPGERNLTLSGRHSSVTFQYSKAQSRWIIASHSDNRMGDNITSIKGTTDLTVSSFTFADMPGMTLTFTPNHDTVYFNFSASGAGTPLPSSVHKFVIFRLVQDNVAVLGGTNSLTADQTIFNSGTGFTAWAWSANFSMFPVDVTPGVSTSLKIQWRISGSGAAGTVQNLVSSSPDFSHRSLTIID